MFRAPYGGDSTGSQRTPNALQAGRNLVSTLLPPCPHWLTDLSNVHYLFSVRNMFFSLLWILVRFRSYWPDLKIAAAIFTARNQRYCDKLGF
jgi:hypothetical protein